MKRFRTAAALALLLPALAACQNRNGSTDWGRTLGLGALVGGGAALATGVFNDVGNSQREPRYGRGYGRGYAGGGSSYGYRPGGHSGYGGGGGSYGSGYSPAYRGW